MSTMNYILSALILIIIPIVIYRITAAILSHRKARLEEKP